MKIYFILSLMLFLQLDGIKAYGDDIEKMKFRIGNFDVKVKYQDPSEVDIRLKDSRILPFYMTIKNPLRTDIPFTSQDIGLNVGFSSPLEPVDIKTVILEIKRTKKIPKLLKVLKIIGEQSSAFHPNKFENTLKKLELKLQKRHFEDGIIKPGETKEGFIFFILPENSGVIDWCNFEFFKSSFQALQTKGIKVYTKDKKDSFTNKLFKFWEKYFIGRKPPFNKSYAMLVGIGNYEYLKLLSSPKADVQKMQKYLDNQGFDEIITVFDETVTDSMLKKPQDYFRDKIQEEDRFLFYYSGHGVSTPPEEPLRGYLPLVNEKFGSYNHSIAMDNLVYWLDQLEAKHLLVILDCCFSGLAIRGAETKNGDSDYDSRINKDILNNIMMNNARFLLMAGTEGQESIADKKWNGSLFTDAIIKGLEKKADTNSDRIITIKELYVWLKPVVVKEAKVMKRELVPLLKDLGEYGVSKGEFFFVR